MSGQSIYGGSLNPKNLWKTIKYKIDFARSHPDFFHYDGMTVFVGPQGSGKTLSMVLHAQELIRRYPKAKVISNIDLKNIPDAIPFYEFNDLPDLIDQHYNDEKGLIILVDEIQNLMDALESKNVSLEMLADLTQMRKQRIHMICSTQVFGRLIKPARQNFKNICICKCYFGMIQLNTYGNSVDAEEVDGKLSLHKSTSNLWFHHPDYYEAYDTWGTIKKLMRQNRNSNILDQYNKDGFTERKD